MDLEVLADDNVSGVRVTNPERKCQLAQRSVILDEGESDASLVLEIGELLGRLELVDPKDEDALILIFLPNRLL
jgi:hypothetical protein